MSISEMAGSVQKTIFQLAKVVSYYQAKTSRNDKRQQEEIQSFANKLDEVERLEEELTKLQHAVQDLQEKAALAESKATQLERELLETKMELDTTRSQRDALKSTHDELLKSSKSQVSELNDKVENLEQQLDGDYKSGLTFNYSCIMYVLKKECPELNMNKLVAGVNKYMEEHNQRACFSSRTN